MSDPILEINPHQDRFTEKTEMIRKINEIIRAVNSLTKVETIKKPKK